MSGLDRALAAAALLSVAPIADAGGAPDPIVPTSSSRTIDLGTAIEDGVTFDGDGYFDTTGTLGDWFVSESLDTTLSGGTASCAATHDSSVTPDGFSIALSCTAASSNPGGLPTTQGSALTSFSLDFTLNEAVVFAIDAEFQSEFISFDAYSQPSYRLEEVSDCMIGENCIVIDSFSCGTLLKLEPGTYRLTAGCTAHSAQYGQAGDTAVSGSLDLSFTRVEPIEFVVDPSESLFAVDVFIPGVGTEHVETPAQGFVRAAFAECAAFGGCHVLLVDGDLQAVDPEMTIPTPLGDIVVTVDSVAIVESGSYMFLLDGASCGFPDGCCGTPFGTFVSTSGTIAGLPYGQDLDLCAGLGACELVILCGSGPCDCSTQCPGVAPGAPFGPAPSLELVLPSIEYTTEIDLGLGALNPSATFAGTIMGEGTVGGAPCPGDVDGSGAVDVADLVAVILAWGTADPAADIDDDGDVDVADLVAVILAWGPCP